MRKKMLMLMAVCCIGLVGCESSSDVEKLEKLNQQIEVLKAENEKLKNGVNKDITESGDLINETTSSSDNKGINDEKMDYIKNYLLIESANVKMCEGYLGKEPGIENISIKNNGDKNIEKLIVTVYFQDENGKDMAEDSFAVIGGGYTSGNTLKANYSWKMESDKYYPFKNLSDEVDISRNRVEISEIEFGV